MKTAGTSAVSGARARASGRWSFRRRGISPALRIALRFLTARRRSMFMALGCIVLGVGLFVVTQATTSGFEAFFIRTILGTNGAIRVEDQLQDTLRSMDAARGSGSRFQISQRGTARKYVEGIAEPERLIEALHSFPNVSGLSAVLTGPVTVRSDFRSEAVRVYGIDLDAHLGVSDLGQQIVQGDLDEYRRTPAGALLGLRMAQRLAVEAGDTILIDAMGETRRYRVCGLYETGVTDIDRVRIYLHLGEARSLLHRADGASFIQVNLHEKDRAPADAAHMTAVLGHSATSWQERERTWLEVFRALRLSSAVTVSVFTVIAGLAMFNTLAMIVMEKTREIAILRSMGYTRGDILRVFLWQAALVLLGGASLGAGLGAAVTWMLGRVPIRIRGIFATDTFVVAWSPWHYVAAVGTAVVVVMAASLLPARRAARLEPGDVIRGTAQ